jgi:uncharacterized membrane protein YhdT
VEIFVFWLGFSVAIGVWASNRGRSGFGWFLLACLISPLLAGIFLAVTKNMARLPSLTVPSENTHSRCPACAEFVLPEAIKCKHCGIALTPQENFYHEVSARQAKKGKEDRKNLFIGVFFITGLILIVKLFS